MDRGESAQADAKAGARFGNVGAVAFGEPAAATTRLLAGLFDGGLLEAGDGTMAGWLRILESATEERLLVVEAGEPSLDEVLALVCWPEQDAVVFEGGTAARVSIVRPAALLDSARAHAGAEVDAWLDHAGATRVDRADLGLVETVAVGC